MPFLLHCQPLHFEALELVPGEPWLKKRSSCPINFRQHTSDWQKQDGKPLQRRVILQTCRAEDSMCRLILFWVWFTDRKQKHITLLSACEKNHRSVKKDQAVITLTKIYTAVDTTACWAVFPFHFAMWAGRHPQPASNPKLPPSSTPPSESRRSEQRRWSLLHLSFNMLSLHVASLEERSVDSCMIRKYHMPCISQLLETKLNWLMAKKVTHIQLQPGYKVSTCSARRVTPMPSFLKWRFKVMRFLVSAVSWV